MMKMFNLIDIGERAGSGIPNIFSVWKQQGWSEPTILVSSEPDRSTLVLPLFKSDDKSICAEGFDHRALNKSRQMQRIAAYSGVGGEINESMAEEGLIGNRRMYFIYQSLEQGIFVLRDDHAMREHISMPELDSLI